MFKNPKNFTDGEKSCWINAVYWAVYCISVFQLPYFEKTSFENQCCIKEQIVAQYFEELGE